MYRKPDFYVSEIFSLLEYCPLHSSDLQYVPVTLQTKLLLLFTHDTTTATMTTTHAQRLMLDNILLKLDRISTPLSATPSPFTTINGNVNTNGNNGSSTSYTNDHSSISIGNNNDNNSNPRASYTAGDLLLECMNRYLYERHIYTPTNLMMDSIEYRPSSFNTNTTTTTTTTTTATTTAATINDNNPITTYDVFLAAITILVNKYPTSESSLRLPLTYSQCCDYMHAAYQLLGGRGQIEGDPRIRGLKVSSAGEGKWTVLSCLFIYDFL